MSKDRKITDKVRASRTGHTFHERWAARRTLQLIFSKDNLFAISFEGLSSNENLEMGQEVDEIADLVLYFGSGNTFKTCSAQQILQFKYKYAAEPVTSSYLKKTIKKFSVTLRDFKKNATSEDIAKKLSFEFVTNAEFSDELWDAISCLKSGKTPKSNSAKNQHKNFKIWCKEENIEADEIFPFIEFRAGTKDLPAQNRTLQRTVSDWSADSAGQAAKRLYALVELVREKSQIEGQGRNSIRREDVLDALECDEDQLFPAATRFADVDNVVERNALKDVMEKVVACDLPVFLNADGGVGKTVFIRNLAACLSGQFEVILFDCFGGGAYRSKAQARHLPRIGLLQIINELATRGLCDPLLPTDSDQYRLIRIAKKRLGQASKTVRDQSAQKGILLILDAADNAQMEADARQEAAFPKLLLAALSDEPIEGVKLLLTARPGPDRMDSVIDKSRVEHIGLEPFSEKETRQFLELRRHEISDVEFSTAFARSRGNARVLEYLVESWDTNVAGSAQKSVVLVDDLIAQRCNKIFHDLHIAGWNDPQICEFFAALSLLPPPIPLNGLVEALGWSESEVNSAASDLAPLLELVKLGAIFRDEPAETFIKNRYASEDAAQQSIAERLQGVQRDSIYAAEALPHFLVVIGDSDRAYQLSGSKDFPSAVVSEYGRRSIKLARLRAAFSLATHDKNHDRVLSLALKLSQVASANARGDQFIRRSPALAMLLGDTNASRRLFNDQSGWRGARDARLTVAYNFDGDRDEARIHQNRAIGWINWHLHNDDEMKGYQRSGFGAFDVAAVMFLSLLEDEFSFFNNNIQLWSFRFALSVIEKLISLCEQYEAAYESNVLSSLVQFAASKQCQSFPLQIGLLSRECGLTADQQRVVSRAASALAHRYRKKISTDNSDSNRELQGVIASAAMTSILVNSKQSAKHLMRLYQHPRPSGHDYGDRCGSNRVWVSIQSTCVNAWSKGEQLSFHHLMPKDMQTGRKTKSIDSEACLNAYLNNLFVTKTHNLGRKMKLPEKQKQFTLQEQDEIKKGAACVLKLVKPLEKCALAKKLVSNEVLTEFLTIWKSELIPDFHWRDETGRDNIARHVGIGIVTTLLCHCETVEKKEADDIIEIIGANRISLDDRISILALIARRTNLADTAGIYADKISNDIVKDDWIEKRGEYFRKLAASLIPLSIAEAREYYAQGLAQLDQMGGDDFDLIYSSMHCAAEQRGGFLKPELSHRFMGLCQTIFQDEPSKFGWTLFAQAASSSIGFPAMYKLIRWYDQEVVEYSYGLPQLACYLAKERHLDPRRAAVLLTICEDHGWHEWQVGQGIADLLSVAAPQDREVIFSLVAEKLDQEHRFGGWEGLWDSLLECVDAYEEIDVDGLRDRFIILKEAARSRCDTENARRNSHSRANTDYGLQSRGTEQDKQASDKAIAEILAKCDLSSASSLDEAVQDVRTVDEKQFENEKRLLQDMRKSCPYNVRGEFLEAICESTELGFNDALDLMIECVEEWKGSSADIKIRVAQLVRNLFASKGSELFNRRILNISRKINSLSKLCGNARAVLQIVLETIAKERCDLNGNEWLQIATSLVRYTDPSTALEAFEDLLSSSAGKVGDEVGEGAYRAAFSGNNDESEVVADTIWHLLGDSDAFVRWHTARCLKGMIDVGLIEDVGRLLDRFDVSENSALASKEHRFAILNAQQWLLMGLARAALHHGQSLIALRPRLQELAQRTDLHVLNKLHLARCLAHIEGNSSMSPELAKLWSDIRTPQHGIIKRDGWPDNKEKRHDLGFDYEFDKYKVTDLGSLFWISKNEANDFIADEVLKRWPSISTISDFPGVYRFRGERRYETYREHVQRHAFLHAATTLSRIKPVARKSYDREGPTPWQEFLKDGDVSFEDGSWLSDHKDRVPVQAKEYLLGERKEHQEALVDKEFLFRKVGFRGDQSERFLPIWGNWKSPDGVYVNLVSALVKERGAVKKCVAFSKSSGYDLWLPTFNSDGRIDRYAEKNQFCPLVWVTEKYPIGIDENDEWATRGAIERPRLGLALNRILGLTANDYGREWHDGNGEIALKSEVWGEWRPDPGSQRSRYQDEGAILRADINWVDKALSSCGKSLIFKFRFSNSKNSYDETSRVRAQFVGLKRNGENPRFWYAKKASQTVY